MDFIVKVKDKYVTGLGKHFGNELKPEEAIQAVLDKVISEAYESVIHNDADVVQKKAELEAIILQKREETKTKIKR